jgi:hypothetical protein
MLCLPAAAQAGPGDRITIAKGVFMCGAKRVWINGANTPWREWNEFGGRFDYGGWDGEFKALHDHGINATRVWISCDGDVGLRIDDAGHVSGATKQHWENVDSLFEIARRHRVYVLATLLSFDHVKDNHASYRRWRNWLASDANLDSYVDNYLLPFVHRYGGTPYLWAIDLMNEPDWVFESGDEGRFPWARLQSYFARGAAAIHENSGVLVTVGLAMPRYVSEVTDAALMARTGNPDARLDFATTHYYDWCATYWGRAPYVSPAEYGMPPGKPCVIGEMPAKGTQGHTTAEDYEAAFENGWQGAMGWTSDGVDEMGGMESLGPATLEFSKRHPGLVFPN